jgi:hypothetical protein
MKWYFFFIAMASIPCLAQKYTVLKVKGPVYYERHLVHDSDKLDALSKLSSTDNNAAIRVISPASGSIVLSFANGVHVVKAEKKSELYELIVGEYIEKYLLDQMHGRGNEQAFDWVAYFHDLSQDSIERKMLIIEGQAIPLISDFKPTDSFQLWVDLYKTNRDSVLFQLPVHHDSLIFPLRGFPLRVQFNWQLKLRYKDAGTGRESFLEIMSRPVRSRVLSSSELDSLIVFCRDPGIPIRDQYNNLYFFLQFNYGKFYYPLIDERLKAYYGPIPK